MTAIGKKPPNISRCEQTILSKLCGDARDPARDGRVDREPQKLTAESVHAVLTPKKLPDGAYMF